MEDKDVKTTGMGENDVMDGVTITEDTAEPRKKKRKVGKTILKIVIWLVVIAAIIFLTLFLASKIADFESIGAMLDWIKQQI